LRFRNADLERFMGFDQISSARSPRTFRDLPSDSSSPFFHIRPQQFTDGPIAPGRFPGSERESGISPLFDNLKRGKAASLWRMAEGKQLKASSYQTAVDRLLALGHELAQTPSQKFDLAHMRVLLQALDHPERHFPSVLIAGTNGKGSTAATLASILRASGLKTGLYTSPHLVRINERIRVNGEEISDDDFAFLQGEVDRVAEKLVERAVLPWHPSFFEMVTAIALEHFAREKIELAVLEVGMGGRLDATNVVEPRVSVITDISLDHQRFLGNTVTEIAREKVGIIRAGGAVVTLPQQPEANDVIGNTILQLGARAVNAVPYVPPVSPGSSQYLVRRSKQENSEYIYRYPLTLLGKQVLVETPLVGRHQLRNVALAIAAAVELDRQGFGSITPESIERGIRETRWPGRFQAIAARPGWPEMVIDVAHNPAGAWALRSALSERYEDRRLIFIFGAMRDKAIAEMTEILFPLADRVIATRPQNPRAASPEEVQQAATRTGVEVEAVEEIETATERARALASPAGVIVVTGSIYLVGEVMRGLGLQI
jgi:dihydrofolate synthase / folylpolyglutamate synthase